MAIDEVQAVADTSTPSTQTNTSDCQAPKKVKPRAITCTSSSSLAPNWSCRKAFDNVLKIGKAGSAWASRGEGRGAWIMATFDREVRLTKIKVSWM